MRLGASVCVVLGVVLWHLSQGRGAFSSPLVLVLLLSDLSTPSANSWFSRPVTEA